MRLCSGELNPVAPLSPRYWNCQGHHPSYSSNELSDLTLKGHTNSWGNSTWKGPIWGFEQKSNCKHCTAECQPEVLRLIWLTHRACLQCHCKMATPNKHLSMGSWSSWYCKTLRLPRAVRIPYIPCLLTRLTVYSWVKASFSQYSVNADLIQA